MSANSPEVRISDDDRQQALDALGEHMSTGRLDVDEFAERSARAGTARTKADLAPLFADLPQPRPDVLVEQAVTTGAGPMAWLRGGAAPVVLVAVVVLFLTVGRAFWPVLLAVLIAVLVFTVVNPRRRRP